MSTTPRQDWLLDGGFAQAALTQADARTLVLGNGLLARTVRLQPNAATVGLDNLMTGQSVLRAVGPEARVTLDGVANDIGGLHGQPIGNYCLPAWVEEMTADPAAFTCTGYATGPTVAPFPWTHHPLRRTPDLPWPPPGVALALHFRAGDTCPPATRGVEITVHYELYDGLPLYAKWLTLRNAGDMPVTVDSVTTEILAVVEAESVVDDNPRPRLPALDLFSDYATGGGMSAMTAPPVAHWLPDPRYDTQVNYACQTPCLLECRPPLGPGVVLTPGETLTTYRVYTLLHDSTERERQGLALRRAYRAVAPWIAENPILMHVRQADPQAVRTAIDQCADVGFEMVILTFGSGFDIEKTDPAYLAEMRALADDAHAKGIELGGYSLLASRSISAEDDVINPATGAPGGFARFGESPCLQSAWGQRYFDTLRAFYEATGFDMLEHDGSYAGDACASTAHPGHAGYADSVWRQWETIRAFYTWCRGRGIYLNVPDYYFLCGSNKTGMGYRETNWSLPRAYQEIIERQHIYDGTWEKPVTMGWMFVPLTEYHGGGAAATIEPLREHLDHYEQRLANLFGAGVQACWRGPVLYDSAETRTVVARWVAWFKTYRDILESDVIHLSRPDGRDYDGLLHVNSHLPHRGLAMLYNPLPEPITRRITLPLYYTGLTRAAQVRINNGPPRRRRLDARQQVEIQVTIAARGWAWAVIEAAE